MGLLKAQSAPLALTMKALMLAEVPQKPPVPSQVLQPLQVGSQGNINEAPCDPLDPDAINLLVGQYVT